MALHGSRKLKKAQPIHETVQPQKSTFTTFRDRRPLQMSNQILTGTPTFIDSLLERRCASSLYGDCRVPLVSCARGGLDQRRNTLRCVTSETETCSWYCKRCISIGRVLLRLLLRACQSENPLQTSIVSLTSITLDQTRDHGSRKNIDEDETIS